MRTQIILLLCLTATACGKTYRVDPQIQPYIDRYVKASQEVDNPVTVNNLIAQFGSLDSTDVPGYAPGSNFAGLCDTTGSTPTITLSTTDWAGFDDALREELVFHELGHCVLFRIHNDDLDPNGIPVSIMYWQMSQESVYQTYRADWLVEMFWYQGQGQDAAQPGTVIN